MAPFAAAEDRILDAAAAARQSFPLAHLLWCKLQQSAQQINDGGRFEISLGRLARLGDADIEAINALLAAFADVGLVVDGRLATFVERGLTRDQIAYEKKKAAEALAREQNLARSQESQNLPLNGSTADAAHVGRDRAADARTVRGKGALVRAQCAENSPSHAESDTESSESSPLGVTDRIDISPSSSSESVHPREAPTTTGKEIFEVISKVDPANISGRVARAFVPVALQLIAEGVSFAEDIVPEVREIAAHTANPRMTLGDRDTINQIRRRFQTRISGAPPPSNRKQIDHEAAFLRELGGTNNA
jgi:hypothetical protein